MSRTHLAQFDGGGAAVPLNAVVFAGRGVGVSLTTASATAPTAGAGRRHWVAEGVLDKVFADPAFIAAEVQHFRGIGDAGMAGYRQIVGSQVFVEVAVGGGVDTGRRKLLSCLPRCVFGRQCFGDFGQLLLTAAMIAHQHHILEAAL